MGSDEMKKLNALGMYAIVKEHYVRHHKVAKEDLSYIMALTKALTNQILFDHLQDELK